MKYSTISKFLAFKFYRRLKSKINN